MKTILLTLIGLIFSGTLAAQNWVYSAGSIKEDEAMDLCHDPSGNIISAGYFSGPIVFNSGLALNPNALGSPDIYISKSTATGQVLWAKKAGGAGSDRALSVKTDAGGNVYITGFYYGSAIFGSITLTSVSGSQDGFIAKLDANGNFLWAKSFGGNLAEWGNAIAIDDLGNPVITGQFQGAANFNGTTLTSMVNPNTSFSSFDVFVAKYTPAGTLLWVNQGKGKYDDRGLDLITDPANNIYVCGQFSDTIQFQNLHNNTILNATFIIKYNAGGQEQWFRKAAGVFSIAYSMTIDNTNKIYIAGDYQGTLTYFGASGTNFVNGLYTNKAFLLKIDNNGTFVWGRSEGSNNYVSAKRVALDAQQDPYVFGEFACTMKEYSDAYGPGVFNSVGFQDLFITKYDNAGNRQWFRQMGGPRNDKAHGLLLAGINQAVMAGSYETKLNIPATGNSTAIINNGPFTSYSTEQANNYCSALSNYTNYTSVKASGYSDIFIHKGIDLSRNPYDYYSRNGTNCVLNFAGNCIVDRTNVLMCTDTINLCGPDSILANTHANTYSSTFSGYGTGPIHRYKWNNNPNDTLHQLRVTSSGYNSVLVKTLDNCYSSLDTVYVKINALPAPPTITDNLGINYQHPPNATTISLCGPATVTLTGGNIQGNTFQWYSTSPFNAVDSSAIVSTTGQYTFVVTNSNHCKDSNVVKVRIDLPLPNLVPKQKYDTLSICQGQGKVLVICDSVSNPQLNYPYNCLNFSGQFIASQSPGLVMTPMNYNSTYCNLSYSVTATTSGTYSYTIGYIRHNQCIYDTVFYTNHIYVDIKTSPGANLTISGNSLLCPGDTLLLLASLSNFSSPNITYTISPGDSLKVLLPDNYVFTVYLTDTTTGCSVMLPHIEPVAFKPNPFIILNPFNSVICPNDSIKLTINLAGATTYEWHGPGGLITGNSQSIYRQTDGFYHCIVTDNTGCVFTTNTVEIKQYATPYLNASNNVMCNNQPLSLHVITLDSTLISWSAPLTGNGATKLIANPGTYSCSVTMCNITTALSINIIGSNPLANITSIGSTTVCPFDSVILYGNAGMNTYIWQPGNHMGQNYTVHSPGSYTLDVTDQYGCTARSAPVRVAFTSTVVPPSATVNDTICAGQTAALSATSSGTNQLHWFPYSNSGPVLATGNTFATPVLNSQTTYYVASVAPGGCHSTGVPATVYLYASSVPPVLTADTTVCYNDTLKITAPLISGVSYSWTGPGMTANTTNSVVIAHADSSHAGIYILQLSGFGCTSPSSSITIHVINVIAPIVSASDSICENSAYFANITPMNPAYSYSWYGPNNYTATNDSLSFLNAQPNQSGTYTVTATQLGCMSQPATFQLTVLQIPPAPVIISNSPVCVGDSIHFTLSNGGTYTPNWLGPNSFTSQQPSPSLLASNAGYTGIYYVALTNGFCPGPLAYDSVKVLNYPVLTVSHDTTACDANPLTISALSDYPDYLWNTGAVTPAITVTQSGTYWVSSSNGNCVVTDSVHITLVNCNVGAINVFTPNGDGVNDLFSFRSAAVKEIRCDIVDRWGVEVGKFEGRENGWNGVHIHTNTDCENGTYFYVATITTIDGAAQTIKGFVTLTR